MVIKSAEKTNLCSDCNQVPYLMKYKLDGSWRYRFVCSICKKKSEPGKSRVKACSIWNALQA